MGLTLRVARSKKALNTKKRCPILSQPGGTPFLRITPFAPAFTGGGSLAMSLEK